MSALAKPSCRLPTCVVPILYNINYTKIDLSGNYEFEGEIDIHVNLVDPKAAGNSITLHCLELNISTATYQSIEHETPLEAASFNYNIINQSCTIIFPKTLGSKPCTDAILSVKFNSKLNSHMQGLYRSNYTGIDGVERVMVCTQFEATDARRGTFFIFKRFAYFLTRWFWNLPKRGRVISCFRRPSFAEIGTFLTGRPVH